MLKIVDSAGKKIGTLKDDDSAPKMEVDVSEGTENPVINPESKDEEEEEGEEENGSDVQ